MKNTNFDDFLLDPSHDDLDSLHLEAERQLYRKGGLKKLVGKIKNKLTSKKNKKKNKSTSVTDAQAAKIEKVASSNPKGSKSTVAPKAPKATKAPTRKIEVKKATPKVNAPAAKKIKAKEKSFGETFKENRKMQGAGKTFMYKGKKYSTNTKDDLAKSKPKKKFVSKAEQGPKTGGSITKKVKPGISKYR